MPADATPRPPLRVVTPRGGVGRRLRALAGRPPSPAAPWLADHPWRREGALDESSRDVRLALVGGGLATAAGSITGALVLPQAEGGGLVVTTAVVGVFLAVGFWLLGVGVLRVLRRQRHGAVELRFARFPAFLGEPLDVTLVRQGATVQLDGLQARLTCVEESWGPPTSDDDGHARTTSERQLRRRDAWSQTKAVPGAMGTRLPIRFELPSPGPGVAGTQLAAELPRYWELEVWADLPGLDFQAVFLVPVYQRPDPARTEGG